MPGPLSGVTVLDLTRVLAGPYCTMTLGDMGAEVIKIEMPGRGDDTRTWGPPFLGGESYYFLSVNRNKKSLELNLKNDAGREVFLRLAAKADVLVENFRPGTMERLGFGYEDLKALNPRLIYCSITGYGTTGPLNRTAGYDFVLQAEAGLMGLTGLPDGDPMKIGVPLVDIGAAMWATKGILAALFQREKTGEGQYLETSLLEAALGYLSYVAGLYFATGIDPPRTGSEHLSLVPYQAFKGGDGQQLAICVGNDDLWRRLTLSLGVPELAEDSRFLTNPDRVAHKEELQSLIQERILTAPASFWVEKLSEAGVPAGLIKPLSESLSSEQVKARDMVWTTPHSTAGDVRSIGLPVKFPSANDSPRNAPPVLGEHAREILADLGYSECEIERLIEESKSSD